ncbi:MAG TPA: hypothetical protein VNL17_09005 [Verrucomicrobiae bacterium]|nr:hypothetical protein [Verrucomicrobiae bacterium]
MNNRAFGLIIVPYSVVVLALLLTTSCSKLDSIEQQAGKTQDQVSKTQERLGRIEEKLDQAGGSGRFQIVVANESDRGAALFLIDSRSGESWIYRTPQGPVINGFWSSIPRVTYPDEYWQRAFTQGQQATPGGAGIQPGVAQPTPAAPSPPTR